MKTTKTIAILGSTGSIGTQSLDVAAFGGYTVDALAAGRNDKLAEEQIRRFRPRLFAMADKDAAKRLKIAVADTGTKILDGPEGVCALAGITKAETVINSIVGRAGLRPTVAALDAGKRLALANKESLVCAGTLVMRRAKERGLPVIPIDSEHSAIFQCLRAGRKSEIRRLLITASGGPFFGKSRDEIRNMTAKDALKHPTWSMGAKITVDSATMMNKGFEVIEAMHLFGVKSEKIEVLVHRQSIVHSMVEYIDGSVIAQLSNPDMRDAIQYALTCPRRMKSRVEPLDLASVGRLTFEKPDGNAFPLLPYAMKNACRGGTWGACLNGANEGAVALFLAGKIPFGAISELVMSIAEDMARDGDASLDEICEAGDEAERAARRTLY